MENFTQIGNGARLLVVDDQPFFAALMRERFESLGYSVTTAHDAFQALATVAQVDVPLVVLLDLMLPKVSGHQLLHELAKSPSASRLRVVLVSGHHSVERVAVNNPMVVGRAHKPVDLGELTRMVEGASRSLAQSLMH